MNPFVKKSMEFRRNENQRGSVAVEFAACAVFLFMIFFGIIQYSLIISSLNSLTQVTREGARYFAVHFSDANANAETINYMQTVASGSFLTNSDISLTNFTPNASSQPLGVTIEDAGAAGGNTFAAGDAVTVEITYNMAKRTFFAPFVPGVKSGTNDVVRSTTTLLE